MGDHDQRFKVLLQTFLAEFFELFFPDLAERFDFTRVEWLDKEMFSDRPQGERRYVDLVAKLRTRQALASDRPGQPDRWIALIHVEIEHADSIAPLRPRMFDYYQGLRRRHDLPVLPIGLYLRVGQEGIGWDIYEERFWDKTLLRFEYLYVGLPALDAEHYLQSDSWLGIALSALMRVPQEKRTWLKAEALRRLQEYTGNDYQRFLLCEVVQAYLPLNEAEQAAFNRLLETDPYKEVQAMATTWFEQGMAKGQRAVLQVQLEERFGSLSPEAKERLANWPAERLAELGRALLKANSLRELGLENGQSVGDGNS